MFGAGFKDGAGEAGGVPVGHAETAAGTEDARELCGDEFWARANMAPNMVTTASKEASA
jgi:hypothetical protein